MATFADLNQIPTDLVLTDKIIIPRAAEDYYTFVNDVARAIIEQYNGSTIAGSAQTLQAALNTLNGNLSTYNLTSSENLLTVVLDDTKVPLNSIKVLNLRNANTSDLPNSSSVYGLAVARKRTAGNCTVTIYAESGNEWSNNAASGTWRGWKQTPTRAEMDSVTNQLGVAYFRWVANSGSQTQIRLTFPNANQHRFFLFGNGANDKTLCAIGYYRPSTSLNFIQSLGQYGITVDSMDTTNNAITLNVSAYAACLVCCPESFSVASV